MFPQKKEESLPISNAILQVKAMNSIVHYKVEVYFKNDKDENFEINMELPTD